MRTLLDAYALVAFLGGEPCGDEVEALLRADGAISAVNLAEVVDRMARVHAINVQDDIDALTASGLAVLPVELDIARHAGTLRAIHYHRERLAVSMADCIATATAVAHDLPLATSDGSLATLLTSEGGRVVALPDSRGMRPGT